MEKERNSRYIRSFGFVEDIAATVNHSSSMEHFFADDSPRFHHEYALISHMLIPPENRARDLQCATHSLVSFDSVCNCPLFHR